MSTLVMPLNYVEIDREEMTYIEGGAYYLSNSQLKGILTACALNPIGATVLGLAYWKAITAVSAQVALLGAKFGAIGGIVGATAGLVIGGVAAATVATAVVDAIYEGKGIEFGFTWRPTLTVK